MFHLVRMKIINVILNIRPTQVQFGNLPHHCAHGSLCRLRTGRLPVPPGSSWKWWPDPIKSVGIPRLSMDTAGAWCRRAIRWMCASSSRRSSRIGAGVRQDSVSIQKLWSRIKQITSAGTLRMDSERGLLSTPQRWTKIPKARSMVILNWER